MAAVGIFAWVQWREADRAKLLAQAAEYKAERTQSLFLADLAHQQRTAGDAGTAIPLAVEALPDHAG
jgi:hypothetical protein